MRTPDEQEGEHFHFEFPVQDHELRLLLEDQEFAYFYLQSVQWAAAEKLLRDNREPVGPWNWWVVVHPTVPFRWIRGQVSTIERG